MPRVRNVSVISLGCPKNLVDSEHMCGQLAATGEFAFTPDPEAADLLLLNTCCFIAPARKESEDEIRNALRWKRKRRGRRVVVAGCLAQKARAELLRRYRDLDLVLTLDEESTIVDRLRDAFAGGPATATDPAEPLGEACYLLDHSAPRLLLGGAGAHSAYVKIAEGCDHTCRFCAIPNLRGRQRSRAIPDVVAECRQLLDQGLRELIIVAQDTSNYGSDRHDGTAILPLLREIDALEGEFWLRLLYVNPFCHPDGLGEFLAGARHAVPYLDLPLQHVAMKMLLAMGRGRRAADLRELVRELRQTVPGLTLRTTFLVGFPGETDDHFAELLAFAEEFRFERLGVFTYSAEEGTPAAGLREGLVPPDVATQRRDRLMTAQQAISLARNEALLGQTLPLLIDRPGPPGTLLARTAADAPEIDNLVHLAVPPAAAGDVLARGFVQARITGAEAYDLHAELPD